MPAASYLVDCMSAQRCGLHLMRVEAKAASPININKKTWRLPFYRVSGDRKEEKKEIKIKEEGKQMREQESTNNYGG